MMDFKRNVLITGGAGFIGSHVVRLFVTKYPEYHIINLDKLTYAGNLANLADIEQQPNYTFVKADICDFEKILELFRQHSIDGVIHLAAESQKDSYGKLKFFSSFSISPSWLIQGTRDNSTPAWMNEDGTLKEDALKEYLEQVNRIWQTQKDAIEETKKAYQMGDDWANSDRSGYTNIAGSITDLLVKVNTVAAGGLLSPEGLVYLDSAKKVDPDLDYRLLNGQSENCFYPRSIVGISAKASEKEAAEKFVKFLFEEESQRASNDEGLAVNSKVYEDMAYWKMGKSSGDTIGSIGTYYDTGDGNIKQFVMDEIIPEDEAIQNIMDLGKTLTVPAKSNQIIRSAVTESGEKYLTGETGLDDAVKEIMQEVNLYLSE